MFAICARDLKNFLLAGVHRGSSPTKIGGRGPLFLHAMVSADGLSPPSAQGAYSTATSKT